MLTEILKRVRSSYDREKPLYLLYKLTDVQMSPSRMAEQEMILKSDQTFCAIVVESDLTRKLIQVAIWRKKNAKVCASPGAGKAWLHGCSR